MSRALIDPNRKATLIAKSDTDEDVIVEVTANPITGAINVETTASIGTQYDSGDATPATPTGTIPVFDNAGTITHVSAANPLPVSATIDTTGLATQTTLAAINTKLVSGTDIGDVTINNASGASAVNIQDGGNTITVDGTVGITANSSVNVAQMNGVTVLMGNGASGTGAQRVTIASDSTGQIKLAAGTAGIGKLTANSGVDIGDVDVLTLPGIAGTAAHDAAVSGNPILNGAEARSTDQAVVTTGDVTRLQATLTGKQVVMPYAIPENSLSGTASATNTSDTSIIAAQGAGIRIYVTSIIISNSSATATEVVIKSATTARITYPAPATSGAVHSLPFPLQLAANEALNFASLASVTTMKVSAVGYKGV